MVRKFRMFCAPRFDYILAGGALSLFVLIASAVGTEAQVQYRPGAFVNGQPVFASRRPRGRIMRLRARRQARRSESRRPPMRISKRASPRILPVARAVSSAQSSKTVQQARRVASPVSIARSVQTNDTRKFSVLPPLPSPRVWSPAVLASAQGRRSTRNILRLKKRQKLMQIVVSLSRQRLTVYEDGRPVSRSSVSTGKRGHVTPTGVFSIIQKRRHHRSNIYSGAPMPYMQRITWSGIALHQGLLPGYPASHGCVRLPGRFASKLFRATRMRTHVVVARDNPAPSLFSHPNLPGISDLEDQELAVLEGMPEHGGATPPAFGALMSNGLRVPVSWAGQGDDEAGQPTRGYAPEVYRLAAVLHFDESEQLAHRHRATRTRHSSPLRILVTRRTQRDQIRDVQRQLIMLGYDVGGLDGQMGRMMITAIRAFQTAHNLRSTGYADAATRDLLDAVTGLPRPAAATVYIRQDGKPIYSGPVKLARAQEPIGTHLYSLIDLDDQGGRSGAWTAMTVQAKGRLPSWSRRDWLKRLEDIAAVSAEEAISRVVFPAHVRATIEDRLTPGSSLIIADRGSERETGLATDFVVLTD